jgi:hypothetical protein
LGFAFGYFLATLRSVEPILMPFLCATS